LGIVGGVEDQHLVGVLAQNVESVAHRIGQQIDKQPGHVHHGSALIGVAVINEQAETTVREGSITTRHGASRGLKIDSGI